MGNRDAFVGRLRINLDWILLVSDFNVSCLNASLNFLQGVSSTDRGEIFVEDRLYRWQCRRSRRFLTYYATKFDTVEVDSTFYRTPSVATVNGWERKTPTGFSLAAKVPQTIHARKS